MRSLLFLLVLVLVLVYFGSLGLRAYATVAQFAERVSVPGRVAAQ